MTIKKCLRCMQRPNKKGSNLCHFCEKHFADPGKDKLLTRLRWEKSRLENNIKQSCSEVRVMRVQLATIEKLLEKED